jgi:hypothetical protein
MRTVSSGDQAAYAQILCIIQVTDKFSAPKSSDLVRWLFAGEIKATKWNRAKLLCRQSQNRQNVVCSSEIPSGQNGSPFPGVIEGAVAIGAGIAAHSLLLVAFGIYSAIELACLSLF